MSSREKILLNIRKNKPDWRPLHGDLQLKAVQSDGQLLFQQFVESLSKAGAEVNVLNDEEQLQPFLQQNFSDLINLLDSEVFGRYKADVSKSELKNIPTVVIPGQIGVAENGAIWIDERNFQNRLLPFITEQLVIVLNKASIVKNMHEAYKLINPGATGFGVFISGPSKTADIEQSLVYGAHGAKKLWVLLF